MKKRNRLRRRVSQDPGSIMMKIMSMLQQVGIRIETDKEEEVAVAAVKTVAIIIANLKVSKRITATIKITDSTEIKTIIEITEIVVGAAIKEKTKKVAMKNNIVAKNNTNPRKTTKVVEKIIKKDVLNMINRMPGN